MKRKLTAKRPSTDKSALALIMTVNKVGKLKLECGDCTSRKTREIYLRLTYHQVVENSCGGSDGAE